MHLIERMRGTGCHENDQSSKEFSHGGKFHITYYPPKEWAFSIPVSAVCFFFAIPMLYFAMNSLTVPAPTSLDLVQDDYSRKPSNGTGKGYVRFALLKRVFFQWISHFVTVLPPSLFQKFATWIPPILYGILASLKTQPK
eukprot:scaffold22586_cov138-Cylindrotheca_fusiformis.AAC.23